MSTKIKLYADEFRCPECGSKTVTVDSRYAGGIRTGVAQHRRRRRECPLKHRFSTYERVKTEDPEFTLTMVAETLTAIAAFLIEKENPK